MEGRHGAWFVPWCRWSRHTVAWSMHGRYDQGKLHDMAGGNRARMTQPQGLSAGKEKMEHRDRDEAVA
jgi:hypothetical protein